jgi:hypothetical protein
MVGTSLTAAAADRGGPAVEPDPVRKERISDVPGRSPGSGARQRRTSGSNAGGTADRSCSPRRTRSMMAIAGPVPNGGRPLAANTTVAAQECTSEAVVASSPYRISGAR